eukprot:14272-Amphidinium_carterae.1
MSHRAVTFPITAAVLHTNAWGERWLNCCGIIVHVSHIYKEFCATFQNLHVFGKLRFVVGIHASANMRAYGGKLIGSVLSCLRTLAHNLIQRFTACPRCKESLRNECCVGHSGHSQYSCSAVSIEMPPSFCLRSQFVLRGAGSSSERSAAMHSPAIRVTLSCVLYTCTRIVKSN